MVILFRSNVIVVKIDTCTNKPIIPKQNFLEKMSILTALCSHPLAIFEPGL